MFIWVFTRISTSGDCGRKKSLKRPPGLPIFSCVSSENTSDLVLILKVKWTDLAGQLEWGSVGNLSVVHAQSPASLGNNSGSGYLVVSGGLCQSTALRVLYCLPGFHQDNTACPSFTSEMFSSDTQLGRGNPNPQRVAQSPQQNEAERGGAS